MLRVIIVGCYSTRCAAVLQFMEEVFSNQLAELEKDGLMVDGIHHRFTFFNKVY